MAAPKDQFPAMYEKAIQKYREITNETLEVDFLSKIRNVEDLSKEIDERNRTFREFREKRGAIFDALESAMIPVQLFGNLAAGVTSMAFPPSCLVFGAVAHLMTAARGVSAAYDAIQDLMQMLQDFTVRFRAYTQETISGALNDKLSDIFVSLIEVLALSTKTIRRGRLLKFTKNILLGSDDAIQAAMLRLDKLTQVETILVGAETLTESKKTGRVVNGISVTVNATNATVMETGVAVSQISGQVHEVHETLGKLVASVHEGKQESNENQEAPQQLAYQILRPSMIASAQESFDKINKARVPGTGAWVVRENVFQCWINKEMPIMFISGNPGAGKSFLATNIINFLHDQFPQQVQRRPVVSVGYFFFKNDNPKTRSFHQALRDIALQISKSDPIYQKHLGTIRDYEEIGTLESAWRLLFVEYFLKNPNIDSTAYILLDAVDEALDEEWRIFVDLAKDLYENKSRLQLAIVGRPYISNQLLEGLEDKVPTIHVTKQKNSGDISQYIHAKIKKSVILRKVSGRLREEIVDTLSAGAEGMFLWVNLTLQEVCKKRNETSMRKALEQAPRGLKEMFRHVLASLSASSDDEELEYLNELLLWVACTDSPWTLAELEATLKLKSPEGDGMVDLEGALRRQWASFFTLQREDGLTTAELEDGPARSDAPIDSDYEDELQGDDEASEDIGHIMDFKSNKHTTIVTFCHASIGDFFRDGSEGKVSATEGHIAVGVNYYEAKAHVMKTYLRLIIDPKFASKADDSERMLEIASREWSRHLRNTSPSECLLEDKKEIAKMLLTIFRSEEFKLDLWGSFGWALSIPTIDAIPQWWQEQDVLELLTPEEKEFISTTENEPAALLKPIVTCCLKRWLCEDHDWDPSMVRVVSHYQMLIKGEDVNNITWDMKAEDVIEAAEYGGFEKTSSWFRQCATALRGDGHLYEALQYYTKALKLDPDYWRTLNETAITYYRQRDFKKALEFWERTRLRLSMMIAESPEDGKWKPRLHKCLHKICHIYEHRLKDKEKQFETLQEAYQHAPPSCSSCVPALLRHYNSNHAHEASMDLLRKLADTPVPEGDCSELIRFLLDDDAYGVRHKSSIAADAAMATNNLDFLLETLRTAARKARKNPRKSVAVMVDMVIAQIYNDSLGDHAKAIRRWEKIIDTYSSSEEGKLFHVVKKAASYNLARELLYNAIEAGVETPEAKGAVIRLEKLVQRSQSFFRGISSIMPAIYLGIYYRLRGQDALTRSIFQPLVQQSFSSRLDGLTVDLSCLHGMEDNLVKAGDWKNAVAIIHKVAQYNSDPWFICCGPCRRRAPIRNGFSLCSICLKGEFCPDCVQLVDDGTMPTERCISKHAKYFIFIPPQLEEIGSDMMLVDGEQIEFKTWRNQLKEEWGLNDSKPLGATRVDSDSIPLVLLEYF